MPRRILVILFPVLGDVLLGTPLLRALRRRYPDARIDVLVNQGCGLVLAGNPDVNHVIELARRPDARGYLELARRILRRYDLAVSTALSDRAALYAWAAAPQRVTWTRPAGRGLGWKRRVFQRWPAGVRGPQHPLAMNRRLAGLLGLDTYDGRIVPPRSDGAAARVDALLANCAGPVAVLHPASRMAYKHWRAAGWQALAAALLDRGCSVVVSGGGSDAELHYLQSVFGELPAVVLAAGRLQIGDLGELLARATLFVGVDTVVTHLAAGLGTPTVVLFGPEDPRVWAPWPRPAETLAPPDYPGQGDAAAGNVRLLHARLPCVPCRRAGCDDHPRSRSACLDAITPARVMAAVDDLLGPATAGSTPLQAQQ